MHDDDIVRANVANYSGRADSFSTWANDKANASSARVARDAFLTILRHSQSQDTLRVIDAGCGSGRDVHALAEHSFLRVEGLEPCEALARIAESKAPNCKIHVTDFHTFFCGGDCGIYDGIFSIASLFHVPRKDLPTLLSAMRKCMTPGGVLLCSWPCSGDSDRQGSDGRWHNVMPLSMQRDMLESAGFRIEEAQADALSMYNGTWSLIIATS